ncbi:hypothetical protein [Ruminococcus sp.]|uniref:hypothetical protein n=1 Tax=Ruminococcus sp. TaxID=41978 RepID=UPI00388FF765
MAIITVKSQEELDRIPLDTEDTIRIEFGTAEEPAVVRNQYRNSVRACDNSSVEAYDNSSVLAHDNSSVEAFGNSSVWAFGNSSVEAFGNSSVEAYDNSSVRACDNSIVRAYGNSSVEAYDNSSVDARGNSSVVAYDNSIVRAYGNSIVRAHDSSSVEAYDNSSVWARGNSSVDARGNSSVRAYGNSSVVAYDNSIVRAYGNVQVVDYLQGATIQLSGNARTVYMPRDIEEYMAFYGIEHDDTYAIFYKAVHKTEDRYFSNYDSAFEYKIGETIKSKCFDNRKDIVCTGGIHMIHQAWALDFGGCWSDLAIIEVKARIKDIVVPVGSDGKVRAPEVEVIREVPLEECGVLGEILLKKRAVKA